MFPCFLSSSVWTCSGSRWLLFVFDLCLDWRSPRLSMFWNRPTRPSQTGSHSGDRESNRMISNHFTASYIVSVIFMLNWAQRLEILTTIQVLRIWKYLVAGSQCHSQNWDEQTEIDSPGLVWHPAPSSICQIILWDLVAFPDQMTNLIDGFTFPFDSMECLL